MKPTVTDLPPVRFLTVSFSWFPFWLAGGLFTLGLTWSPSWSLGRDLTGLAWTFLLWPWYLGHILKGS